jgi:hypothetical protein
MAMSDCEKCWDTPCECGWEYRNWSKDRLIAMRDMFQQLIDGTHEYSVTLPEDGDSDYWDDHATGK